MTQFFTRKGDQGDTGLLGEGRVPKFDLRMETLGALDETVSALGMARALADQPAVQDLILGVQRDLYHFMAEVAATPDHAAAFRTINNESVEKLEYEIAHLTQHVNVPKEFIIPGDSLPAAVMDLARTIARRAERRVVELSSQRIIENDALISYMNRLSSLLFILELHLVGTAKSTQSTLAKVVDKP